MKPGPLRLAVLRGDGIGPEVVGAAVQILSAAAKRTDLEIDLTFLPIGFEAYEKNGRTLPVETIKGMKDSDGWIFGPLSAGSYPKDDPDYPMASGKIRKMFDLYANIRPVKSLVNFGRYNNVDLLIVRENTEDFYPDRNLFKGYGEFWPDAETVVSLRVVTRKACRRIAETAFKLAMARKKRIVTAVHKSNVLIEGDGLFLDEVRKISTNYRDVKLREGLVDSIGMQLVMEPEKFDVLVTTNMFGDILSDVAAGTVGGLGLAPSLNSGEDFAMAQAVHGSAPDIAGKNIANPTAEILSTVMLLRWIYSRSGDPKALQASASIEDSCIEVLQTEDISRLTPDLGGKATTQEFSERIIQILESQ